jgi:two-component system, OmpR family, sensor histidine kinase CiaH
MPKHARIQLTVLYLSVFLFFLWFFSIGVYIWFEKSLGNGFITQVQEKQSTISSSDFNNIHRPVIIIAGQVALTQLRKNLLFLNLGFLIIFPIISWYLTKLTLNPIENTYEKQKQFISDASHELRTPLSILSGEMELALNKNRTITEYKSTIESSREEINRLTNLINNLLFLVRGDFVRQRILISEIDLTDVLNSIINRFSYRITAKQLDIHLIPATSNPTIHGSQTMIETLFSNLLDNAIKYTPDNGHVTISIDAKIKYVTVNIKDSGIGITKNETEKIFDRFYRSDTSRSTTKGFGLGLSISKSIVDAHKGTISVKSQLGKGTNFKVYLPRN